MGDCCSTYGCAKPRISIVILTFNRCLLLRDLLGRLMKLTYPNFEVIVVDNHSEDGTEEVMKEFADRVEYIRTSRNLGAGARNLGMKRAEGEIVITLDDDISGISEGDLLTLIDIFEKRRNVGAVNFKVTELDGKICNWVHHYESEKYADKEFRTYEITEGAVAFRKKALEKAGYYTEYFFLSHEGPDLALRLIDSRYKVIYSHKIIVVHTHSELSRKKWYNYYYDTRNQIWMAVRNFPFSYSVGYLSRGLPSMLVYSIRDGFAGFWVKAIIDALRELKMVRNDRKVLSREGMKIIRQIDELRPSFFYMAKRRLFNKGVRL